MHRDTLKNSGLRILKNKRLLAHIGHQLRPEISNAESNIYSKGDEINSFIIVTSGIAAFIE